MDLQEDVLDAARTQVSLPGQHVPWVPHVTAGYSMDPGQVSYTGQVLFDRSRVRLEWEDPLLPLLGATVGVYSD